MESEVKEGKKRVNRTERMNGTRAFRSSAQEDVVEKMERKNLS
jgi:hypothetical protein